MNRLLALSRVLHGVGDLEEVMDHVVAAISRETRYRRAWLVLPFPGPIGLEVVGYALPDAARVRQRMATLDVQRDPWLAHLLSTTDPIVVDDLRTVPIADQAQVAYFGNRTLVAVPMLKVAERIGVFCVGTFAADGVVPPTVDELAFVVETAALVSAVAARIRAETAHRELEERLRGAARLESLGRMAGEITHDFNNLLQSILGNADLALGLLHGHPAEPLLREIALAGDRAAGLSRQLLAFSRGQPIERRQLRVEAIVEAFAPVLRSVVPASVALEVRSAAGLPPIEADAGQLEQVLMNLVVNARDAVDTEGSIVVEVGTVSVDAPGRSGDFVVLSVTDTGAGMGDDVRARVFEPYYSTKAPSAGTGLGLAVVDSVVRRHDGFIEVASAPGHGSSFRVHFPVAPLPAAAAPAPPAPAAVVLGGAERVLVVDDDAQVRSLLDRVLTRAGYHVTLAADGQAALDVLERGHVDLVVSDVVMPRLSGDALTSLLRSRPGAPQVLVMSGYAPRAAIDGPYEHVIAKPFALRDLLRKVREILTSSAAPIRSELTLAPR